MPEISTAAPDITALVHRALLASTARVRDGLAAVDPGDRRRHQALDRWFAGLAAEIRSHHELVETTVLPALAARGAVGDELLDTIAGDHADVDRLVDDLGDALGILSFGLGDAPEWLRRASALVAGLERALTGQLDRELHVLAPIAATTFGPDELEAVRRETVRGIATGRGGLSLAWLCEHVDDDERATVLAEASGPSRLMWRSRRRSYGRSTASAFRPS